MFKEGCAFAFQGVGIDYRKLVINFDEEEKCLLEEYSTITKKELGVDILNYLFSPLNSKEDVFCSWVVTYVCDYIIYKKYIKLNIKPDIFVGYSMGLTTALVCGGAITFVEGLYLLKYSYEYEKSEGIKEQMMAAIIGFNLQDIRGIIDKNNLNGYVGIAIENNENCIIVAGIKDAVKKVMNIAAEEGALKVKDLKCPIAFHTKYAEIITQDYIKYLKSLEFKDSKVPILSTLDQSVIQDRLSLKSQLVDNLLTTVMWKDTILELSKLGIKNIYEVSLSDALTRSSKIISREYNFYTYKKVNKR